MKIVRQATKNVAFFYESEKKVKKLKSFFHYIFFFKYKLIE